MAQGVTIEELLAQIAQLQAQLMALQGTGTGTGSAPAACSGITLSRTLVKGSTGDDVKCVQALLNTDASTQIATTGVGSPGSETTYYGNLTVAAVKKFQAKYGTGSLGTVGPLTRAKMNTMLSSGTGGSGGTVTPIPTGTGLTVALSATNPASGTVVDGQALYPLARLTFTNGDNAEVKVTMLKLKRYGVSADASITNTYLFDGATRLTDGAAVSSTIINFNNTSGLFMVPAGGSKTISILADVNGDSGETMGVQVVASTDVTTNASSVNGTFPVSGNLHTLATGTLAGVEFNATTTPSSAATIDPQNDYTVWQNSVIVTTRAVDMTRISFRKTGSIKDSDLQNFRLYVDGVQVGSAIPNIVLSANNESLITFDLAASPKRLEAGTRVVKLVADIIGGSSLKFTFNLWSSSDVTVVDTQYMANVLPDLISNGTFTKRSTAEMTVGSGTITFTKKTDSPSGNIVDGASNALLAKFEVKAAGEKVKIENLYVSARVNTAAVSGLRNGMLLANGVQIGSTTTLYDPDDSSFDYTTFNLGSSLIVEPGSPVTLEVRADVFDTGTSDTTNSIVSDSTIQVVIEGSSTFNNATGQSSATTIDAPASDVSANTLTVAQGSLSLSKYSAYTDQTAVQPLTAYKLAHYTLTANTTEAVNMTNINVTLDEVSSYISNLYVKYGDQTTSTKASITAASNDWSVNYTIPTGTTIDMIVYGDVATGNGQNGSGIVTMAITGTTVSSAVAANASAVNSQTTTYTTGSFVTAFANTPQNQAVSGNQQVEAGRFKFTSSYQKYTITELRFNGETSATAADDEAIINNAILKDGSTVIKTVPFNDNLGYFNFTGLSIDVPASTSKTLTLVWDLAIPSATASTSGVDARAELQYIKYQDPNGTVTTDSTTTREANRTIVYRAVPTISQVDLVNNTIANGQVLDLYKFKVTAPLQGEINIKQFKLDLAWSDGGTADTPELESLLLLKDGVDITSSVTIQEEDGATSVKDTTGVVTTNSKIIVTWNSSNEDTIQPGTSTTYTVRGTPQGFRVNGATDTAQDSVAISFTPDTSLQTDGYNYLNAGDTLTTIVKLYNDNVAGNSSAEDADLIWSDGSAVAHTAAVGTSSTNDWFNSYLILDSLSSETWSR